MPAHQEDLTSAQHLACQPVPAPETSLAAGQSVAASSALAMGPRPGANATDAAPVLSHWAEPGGARGHEATPACFAPKGTAANAQPAAQSAEAAHAGQASDEKPATCPAKLARLPSPGPHGRHRAVRRARARSGR